jgi:hypothetical protein
MRMKSFMVLTFSLLSLFVFGQCLHGDCENGVGEKMYKDSTYFSGSFEKGHKNKGVYRYKNGDMYLGSFVNNMRQGAATYVYSQSANSPAMYFEGEYIEDKKVFGTLYYRNGDVYNGQFEGNKRNGVGSITLNSGKVWEGNWKDDKPDFGFQFTQTADSLSIDTPSKGLSNKEYDTKGQVSVYAVIVGVADYQGTDMDLNYSDDDAILFYKALKKVMPTETTRGEVTLITDSKATSSFVLSELNRVFAKAGDNDLILFYFSGHGGTGVLCAADRGSILHSDIKQIFQKSKGKYRACIADACLTGSIQTPANGSAQMHEMSNDRVAILMSSRANEYSRESSKYQQGFFTYYLVNGMLGKADLDSNKRINMAELFIYTKINVAKASGGSQHPVALGNGLDKFPISVIK